MSHARPLVLIVVGAHPTAELYDRGLAYRLREAIVGRLARVGVAAAPTEVSGAGQAAAGPIAQRVLVLSDLWYLNHDQLRSIPTISVGGPGVNALTAHWGDKLPSVLAVDGSWVVQMAGDAGLWEDAAIEPGPGPGAHAGDAWAFGAGTPLASCWGADPASTLAAVQAFTQRFLEQFLEGAGLAG